MRSFLGLQWDDLYHLLSSLERLGRRQGGTGPMVWAWRYHYQSKHSCMFIRSFCNRKLTQYFSLWYLELRTWASILWSDMERKRMTVIITILAPISMLARKYQSIGRFTFPVTKSPTLIQNLLTSLRSDTSSPETMDSRYVHHGKSTEIWTWPL